MRKIEFVLSTLLFLLILSGCTLDATLDLNSRTTLFGPDTSTVGGLNPFAHIGVYQKNIQYSIGDTDEKIRSIVSLGNGKILIAGILDNPNTYRDFFVARLNSDGTIDDSFGEDGYRSFDLGSANYDDLYRMAVDQSGRIIVVGNSNVGSSLYVARLTSDGNLDANFGNNGGIVQISITGASVVGARALLITSTQEILVGGFGYFGGAGLGRYDFVSAKLNSDGDIETSWGGTGIVKTDLGVDTYDYLYDFSEDNNSNIVAVGASYVSGLATHDMGIVRYTSNGFLDSSFNASGKWRFDFGNADGEYANSVQHDSQDRIIIAGSSKTSTEGDFAIVRLTPTGNIDSTFDSDGVLEISSGSSEIDRIVEIYLLPDDSIVAVGEKSVSGNSDFCALRVLPSGNLDLSFSVDGIHCEDMSGNNDYVHGGSTDANGAVYIAGQVRGGSSYDDLAILKLSNTGTPSTTFSSSGKYTNNIGTTSQDRLIEIKSDQADKVIALADSYALGVTKTALTRINADGSKDASFGNNGVSLLQLHPSDPIYASALALTPENKWVVAGGDSNKFVLARVLDNGSLDTTFNSTGIIEWTAPSNHYIQIFDILVDSQNRIVVAGSFEDLTSTNTFLARFLPTGSIDTTFATNGIAIDDINSGSTDQLNEIAVDSNGNIFAVGTTSDSVTNNNDVIVIKYNGNGIKDNAFGVNGVSKLELEPNAEDYGNTLGIDSNDSLFIAGSISSDQDKTYLIKLSSSGSPDTAFGQGQGYIFLTYGTRSTSSAVDLILTDNNNIVLFGENSDEFTLSLIKPNGELETNFKDGGNTSFEIISSKSHEAKSIISSGDGGFYLGGQISGDSKLLITKVRSNGTLLSDAF